MQEPKLEWLQVNKIENILKFDQSLVVFFLNAANKVIFPI